MPGPVAGMFFYLYLIVDIDRRKIVDWEVHERESAGTGGEADPAGSAGRGLHRTPSCSAR